MLFNAIKQCLQSGYENLLNLMKFLFLVVRKNPCSGTAAHFSLYCLLQYAPCFIETSKASAFKVYPESQMQEAKFAKAFNANSIGRGIKRCFRNEILNQRDQFQLVGLNVILALQNAVTTECEAVPSQKPNEATGNIDNNTP
jgi:hypothetical protein